MKSVICLVVLAILSTAIHCSNIVRCNVIGLQSRQGKFVSAGADGTVSVNSDGFYGWEHITVEQIAYNFVYLKSTHGKYLSVQPNGNMEWNRDNRNTWEVFLIQRTGNKIGFVSTHGCYVTAQDDGVLKCTAQRLLASEQFTVYPLDCLEGYACALDLPVNNINWEAVSVVYDTNSATIYDYPPRQIGIQSIDNESGSVEQSNTYSLSESVTDTQSFTHTAGVAVTIGTEFSVGVPFIVEGKVSVELSVNYEFSYGSVISVERFEGAKYPCIAAPGKSVECLALLFKQEMDLPYTISWVSKINSDCTVESSGVYRKVAATKLKTVVNEIDVYQMAKRRE